MADWARTMGPETLWTDVPHIVEAHIEYAVADLRQRLNADTDLTDADRRHVMAYAVPYIERVCREELEAAWLQLQRTH
jgi:hypothetical protein